MPPHLRESRQDESLDRMPAMIHLAATSFQVSDKNPLIIEDISGYEVIRGSFHVFVGREEQTPDSLVHAEWIEPKGQQTHQESTQELSPLVSTNDNETHVVAQAYSLLTSLSDITFTEPEEKEEENNKLDFERVRLAL